MRKREEIDRDIAYTEKVLRILRQEMKLLEYYEKALETQAGTLAQKTINKMKDDKHWEKGL